MRLFVAVEVPPGIADAVDTAVAPLRAERALRWTARDAWHLTLAFLGEVDEKAVEPLSTRLERAAARHPAHTLRLSGAGRFGDRTLWIAVRGETRTLGRLAQSVQAAARREGIDVDEKRGFKAHLTLARGTRGAHLRPFVDALADFESEDWPVTRLQLMRSHLGAGPARYETLGSWPLGEGPPKPQR